MLMAFYLPCPSYRPNRLATTFWLDTPRESSSYTISSLSPLNKLFFRKTPGTEDGVLEPIPTFSTCYSAPFIVLHPGRYAEMLASRMAEHKVDCWLINTGWTGGKYGSGKRCPLKYTRAIVDAVHDGSLAQAEFEDFPVFGLQIPKSVNGVPRELLNPVLAWKDTEAFERELMKLAGMFRKAFALYENDVDEKVRLAGPSTA